MFMQNLPKKDPCLENFWPKNPPIWAAHTRTFNMLCTPPPGVRSWQLIPYDTGSGKQYGFDAHSESSFSCNDFRTGEIIESSDIS